MRRSFAFLIAWLIAAPALAGMPPGMRNPQVRPANASAGLPAVDDNLAAGGYPIAGGICAEWGHQVPCNNHYTTARASTKYVSASDGLYVSVPANVMAMGSGNGFLIEEARSNDALWARDMTNVAWVKTTMTTALNAVGIDGLANSATTLTATGANAAAVQTITLASQADNYSVFLKRVTGSGTINLCLAATACGTATACTVTSTTAFTRCSVTATVLNPIVGIQIVTNGDAVIADFNQMEPGSNSTSPCLTTNATCARSFDLVTIIGPAAATLNALTHSFSITNNFAQNTGTGDIIGSNAGGDQPVFYTTTTAIKSLGSLNGGGTLTATLGSGTNAGLVKTALGQTTNFRALVANNGTLVTDTHPVAAVNPMQLGSFGAGQSCDCYIGRLPVWSVLLSNSQLQSLSQ